MASTKLASSSTKGFFQALPTLPPQYHHPTKLSSHPRPDHKNATSLSDDKVLDRILNLYLPTDCEEVKNHIHHIARVALNPSVLAHAIDAETNHPVLRPLTTFGQENRNDPLWTTAGWKALKDIGHQEGVVAVAYEKEILGWNRRVYEFALGHLWSCTATMTGCPMAMTDGAATLLVRHLEDQDGDQPGLNRVLNESFRRLTSRDPKEAWTSGQWMTERTGGSDVSGTETIARRLTDDEIAQDAAANRDKDTVGMPLGPWSIDGFKWFSSATDSEMTVMLACTAKEGLSAFYAPMRRRIGTTTFPVDITGSATYVTQLNGIRIQRLKNKLGTRSLPTAELELKGTRAWLIGQEGQGIKEISAILNITRLHTGAGAAASWSRGLAISRAYSRVRKVRGDLLQSNPHHVRWMADVTVNYWAATHLVFFCAALQGSLEQDWKTVTRNTKAAGLIPKDRNVAALLTRLLMPVMKAQVSVASVHGLRQCMECLGGVGYCENNEDGGLLNIAKIYRDNLVSPIWEGTVSVMAEDVVRVLFDQRLTLNNVVVDMLSPWVQSVFSVVSHDFEFETGIIENRLNILAKLIETVSKEELLYRGREVLEHLEVVVSSCVLVYDASANTDEIATAVASRWIRSKAAFSSIKAEREVWQDRVSMDKRIFLGKDNVRTPRLERL
jgi:alkylation response protein AidB-like acyl-CoA dehydrogenase